MMMILIIQLESYFQVSINLLRPRKDKCFFINSQFRKVHYPLENVAKVVLRQQRHAELCRRGRKRRQWRRRGRGIGGGQAFGTKLMHAFFTRCAAAWIRTTAVPKMCDKTRIYLFNAFWLNFFLCYLSLQHVYTEPLLNWLIVILHLATLSVWKGSRSRRAEK
jgi:hypothetical protein